MPIYIAKALYLSGALSPDNYINANNPRIGYHNIVPYGGVTADSEQAGSPASNLSNPSTAERWRSDTGAEQYVYFNLPVDTWDYLAIGGHNLAGSVYQWEARSNPADPWVPMTSERVPGDGHALIDMIPTQTHTFVRLRIVPASGVLPMLAVVYIGRILTLQRRVYVGHAPGVFQLSVDVVSGMNEVGDYLGRVVKRRTLNEDYAQTKVSAAYYRTYIKPFAAAMVTTPFFAAWRPGDYPNEVLFGWAKQIINPSNELSNGMMQFTFSMRAIHPWN